MMTNNLYIDRWSPALRRAVLRTCPDFFGWPAEQQTRYRVALPEEDRGALVSCLITSLPGLKMRPLSSPDEEDSLPLSLQHQLNEALQPLVGIGEDAFFLNELLEEGRSILDFPTLRDYDENDHVLQERLRSEEDATYQAQPYLGRLYGGWARVLIDGRLAYLTMSMVAGAIHDRIQEASFDELQRQIPHRLVPGPRNGEVEGEMVRWDGRMEAGGQEALLEELQQRVWAYETERWITLQSEWAGFDRRGVYIVDAELPDANPDEINMELVFTDPQALSLVHFESFMADCRSIQRDSAELAEEVTTEISLVRAFIQREHEELRRTFNPKVTRLRKRTKIMMHRQAFDVLSTDEDDRD